MSFWIHLSFMSCAEFRRLFNAGDSEARNFVDMPDDAVCVPCPMCRGSVSAVVSAGTEKSVPKTGVEPALPFGN